MLEPSEVVLGRHDSDQLTLRTAKQLQLLERKFDSFFFFASYEFVSLDDAGARVPPQNRVVVTGRAQGFSFLEPVHRFAQKIISLKPRARRVLSQFRFCPAFGDDSGIICALIFRFYAAQQFLRLRLANPIRFFEAIGEREQKRDYGSLVIRIDSKDVETDAFRFAGFVQQAVALSLLQRGGNGVFVELFQFGHGGSVKAGGIVEVKSLQPFIASILQHFDDPISSLTIATTTPVDQKIYPLRVLSTE